MFEGAQGTLLDIDHGTYPYVTSSNATIGGVCTGLGVPPRAIDGVLGVAKAYTTRVGEGPLPTELTGEIGNRLRETGQEFGAVTGRPRRCGWYDAVAVRYAVRVNGLDALALTKLDVLDGMEELQICTSYRCNGATLTEFPGEIAQLAACEPVYESIPGWSAPTKGARRFADLPAGAQRYIARLEELTGVPAAVVSTGSAREDTIIRDDSIAAKWFGKMRRENLKPAGVSSELRLRVDRPKSIAAASASVNSTPARYCGAFTGGLGSSNLAQAIAPRKRSSKSSFGSVMRTFWLGRSTVGEITWAPTVERSMTAAGLPSSCSSTPALTRNRGARRVPCQSRALGASAVATGDGDGMRRRCRGGAGRGRPPAAGAVVAVGFTTCRV